MATIGSYTAANSIDGSNDYLLIQQSGVYKKISRTVFLGLTGSPVGTSDSQTLTNKVIGNTNTVTVKDANFTLQDDVDTAKQAQFQLSAITTGNTRTYTLPDANATLVGIATTQTLTNKTLTGPTITGGTIDNSTVTVDSIAGHTIATTVTVANLQIANGVLNTANAVTATVIADGAIQPKALTTGTGSGWAWQSWTPTISNFTVGSSTLSFKYNQTGKTVVARVGITMGAGSAMGTAPQFTLPVTASAAVTSGTYLGLARLVAGGAGYVGFIYLVDSTHALMLTSTTVPAEANITATVPGTWGTTGAIFGTIMYEAA